MESIDLLLKKAKNDNEAMEKVLNIFKPQVTAICRQYFLIGGDSDDLIQEGMIGLYCAVNSFDNNKNDNFASYANICINNRLKSLIKSAKSKKNQPLNDYVPIDIRDDYEENSIASKIVLLSHNITPEKVSMDKQYRENMETQIKSLLSDKQYSILIMFLNGYSYIEIAKKIGKNIKFVDNNIQAIKKKLKSLKLDQL